MQSEQTRDAARVSDASARRLRWPAVDRRTALSLGILGIVGAAALSAGDWTSAMAAGYPSWEDVERARNNEAAKAGEVSKIEGLIASLQGEVERTQRLAREAADALYVAQQEYFEAAYRADQLQQQADAEALKAAEAADKAGRVAARLYRNGGDDTSLELFFAGSAANADDLLAKLGTMDKLISRNDAIYADAITARDSAQNLSDQAADQREERDRLQKIAEQKMIEAQQAADAAAAALQAQEEHLIVLQAQLAALKDTSARTLADHQAGVEAERRRREAEEAAARAAAEAAAAEASRAAAAAAAAAPRSSGGGGGGGGGVVKSGGWARPSNGWISSGYGPRSTQCGTGYCSSSWHLGTDFAAGAWAPIYAAASGTVVYAGYNGGYGNYIKIDHGYGVGTGYAHIVDGGIYVSYGQWVNAGQTIAGTGNTGNSFGEHLHFEIYVAGGTTNPVPWLQARGVSV